MYFKTNPYMTRNIIRKILILLFAAALALPAGAGPVYAAQRPELTLRAEAAILLEADTGKVLYAKNEREKLYPASMTKIVTAMVLLDYFKPEELITVGGEVNHMPPGSSVADIKEGETLTVENLLRALIIPSGNDAGCVVAQAVAMRAKPDENMTFDQVEKIFAGLMNDKAKALHASDTHFTNPHGYQDKDHYTTAYDMGLLARGAMAYPLLRKVVAEKSFSGPGAGENPPAGTVSRNYSWESHNLLLEGEQYAYPYATGIKTGFTDEAGQCLAASAETGGVALISVIMKDEDPYRWTDSITLLDFGFHYFGNEAIQAAGQQVDKVLLSNPQKGEPLTMPVNGAEDASAYLGLDEVPQVRHTIEYDSTLVVPNENPQDTDIYLRTPIEAGQVVGTITYILNGETLYTGPVKAARAAEAGGFVNSLAYSAKHLFGSGKGIIYVVVGIAVFAFLILLLMVGRMRRRYRRNAYRLNKRY